MDFIFLVLPAATTSLSFSGDGPPLTAEVCNRWAIKNSGKINLKWDKTKQLFQGLKVQSILVENFLKLGFKMVLFQSNFEHIRRNIAACNTLYTNSSFLSIFSFIHFPQPSFFPQQSFTCFPTTIEFFREKYMVVWQEVKDYLRKN